MENQEAFINPFLGVPADSVLDPASKNFSVNAWLRNLMMFIVKDPTKYPLRSAGVSFKDLNTYGFYRPTDYQKNVGNIWLDFVNLFRWTGGAGRQQIQILEEFNGLVEAGETLLVLGRPGSGCSTLLKTISGDTSGFFISPNSKLNYQGIPAKQMHTQFRGEAIYMAETDVHFPQLTVGQTLLIAAKARAPRDNTFPGVTRDMYAQHMRDVIMATFGLNHTVNTPIGNQLIKGVSGGEKKRVSIAEAALSGSPLQCWDNSTRGLDSANALEFCKIVRLLADMTGTTSCVSLYQCSQDSFNLFDKVTVLYEGRQIYFGPARHAKAFFTEMGFDCAPRQTDADFLTSLTSPSERLIREGFEDRTPRTSEDFANVWKASKEYSRLIMEIEAYNQKYPFGGSSVDEFTASRKAQQAVQQRVKSPYTLSLYQQAMLCLHRGFLRLRGDASLTISRLIANSILSLIVGSMFYNLNQTTESFFGRSALIFLAILLNAFASSLEILILYEQRPIVEKHTRYALYHPFAEAVSSALCDIPFKIVNAVGFNIVMYFLTDLRREPSAFFIFLLFSFSVTLALSMFFRTVGACSRTIFQALPFTAILTLALMTYTGFAVPIKDMHPWFRWINYLDPIAYAFESLMINEFSGRNFECATFIPRGPDYLQVSGSNHVCSTVGSVPGSNFVSGTEYIRLSFNYEASHLWRNYGIIIALTVFFTCTYLLATEFITAKKSKGEVLIFQRGHRLPVGLQHDIENPSQMPKPERGPGESIQGFVKGAHDRISVFQWKNICFDIKISKKEIRRILDHVDGWVKPGSLTALMGASGAGKTSLLDVLATRNTVGVVSGEALVDGRLRDISFQRKTGYAQQQDIHLETMTVREALRFNAILCQPARVSRKEKFTFVEDVIQVLGMEAYADAIIGVPGEGLNVEQRKKLTIGVELAAKPELLLFLDEPSSGLDSQTSWSVIDLLEKLTQNGQAILCTIHQPSALLFQRFHRLLFLAPEGKPVYFGDIGPNSEVVVEYFERNGASPCPPNANPAEWIMETIGGTPGAHSDIDWAQVWLQSPENAEVHRELDAMKWHGQREIVKTRQVKEYYQEFAAPFSIQLWECFKRVNQQYWRSPIYIYSKIVLCLLPSLFIGFSFYRSDNSIQGMQNQAFGIFMLMTQASNLVPQMLPYFVSQRYLFESRERPAKTYSWQVFMISNILVELPWNLLLAVFIFVSWYYPAGLYRNAEPTNAVAERSGSMYLIMLVYLMFSSTCGHMVQSGVELAEIGANYFSLLFVLSLIFCGVLVGPNALPRFWIFMYRVSPFTYLISAILSIALANTHVVCSSIELLHFDPIPGTTCASYMAGYISAAGGYLTNPKATANCSFCPISNTNAFLSNAGSNYDERWRDFGIMWVYVVINIGLALLFYWLVRVPKTKKAQVQRNEAVIHDAPAISATDTSKTEIGENASELKTMRE